MADIQDRYAEINGIRLHYVIAGSGQTLLFLHGFPEFWYAWERLIDQFASEYQVVVPDMRGYNLSSHPAEPAAYTVSTLVADVHALLNTVSPGRKAILVAHDWGGIVAWAFAIAHPEALERLVIINAPHPAVFARELATNPAQQRAAGYMQMLRAEGAEGVLEANDFAQLDAVIFNGARSGAFNDADRAAYHAAWSQPGALTGALNYYRALALASPPPLATAMIVRVPTLVLWGERDTALLTGNLTGLVQFVPDLQVQRFAEGSHWVVHEEPDAIAAAIRAFLPAQ